MVMQTKSLLVNGRFIECILFSVRSRFSLPTLADFCCTVRDNVNGYNYDVYLLGGKFYAKCRG